MRSATDGVLLGIDVGTSGTKALLVTPDGIVIASASSDTPMDTPRIGWAEQDARLWVAAAREAVTAALAKAGHPHVAAIGLTGQMHGMVLLGGDGEPLRPAILWCDQRTTEQCQDITRRVGAQRLIELTCNPALEGFTAPKVLWMRDNEPGVLAKTAHLLLPKDYLRFALSGTIASEVSDASGTLLFDVRHRRWSNDMLAALDVPARWLPQVTESIEVTSHVSAAVARDWGLPEFTPIVGGGGDQAAGGVGNGIVLPGLVSSTIGTSGVVFAFSDGVVLDPLGRVHTFCHAVPDAWHVMGVTQGAGLSLRWWRDNFAASEVATARFAGMDAYDLLCEEAAQAEPGSRGLHWLPYLMGERTPHLDAQARALLYGLSAVHTRSDVLRSVLEGVTFSLRDCLEILREMHIPVTQVRASGGGARSGLWRQMQASVFNAPVVTVAAQEGPAFGAALLAAAGTGMFASVAEACAKWVTVDSSTEPHRDEVNVYQRQYGVYRALYPALRPIFAQTAALG